MEREGLEKGGDWVEGGSVYSSKVTSTFTFKDLLHHFLLKTQSSEKVVKLKCFWLSILLFGTHNSWWVQIRYFSVINLIGFVFILSSGYTLKAYSGQMQEKTLKPDILKERSIANYEALLQVFSVWKICTFYVITVFCRSWLLESSCKLAFTHTCIHTLVGKHKQAIHENALYLSYKEPTVVNKLIMTRHTLCKVAALTERCLFLSPFSFASCQS